MGESVRLLRRSPDGLWAWVENRSDRYRGWVRSWGLRPVSSEENQAWLRRARWRLSRPHLVAHHDRQGRRPVTPLLWNSRLVRLGSDGPRQKIELPDGGVVWVAADGLRPAGRSAGSLDAVIAEFAGVPYLWGGRTPLGFDCSGFVQQVHGARGICLPRDAHDQFLACRAVARGREKPGDLLFFGPPRGRISHVAILVSRELFSHARGTVGINSICPGNAMYDKDLARIFAGFGRPRPGSGKRAYSC